MNSPFFSFIIPVYNVEQYLEECIDSILMQVFIDYEIIIINDGSTDNSPRICNYYEAKDNRVRVMHKHNEGLAQTRNQGLKIAKGKYLIFVDGDDHIEKSGKSLLDIYRFLVVENSDLIIFNLSPFVLNNDLTYKLYDIPKTKKIGITYDLDTIFKSRVYLASACNKIVKREVITKNSLEFPKGLLSEDIKWCGDLLMYSEKIVFYPVVFYFYRKNREGSITYITKKKNLLDIADQVNSHFVYMKNNSNYNNKKYLDEFYSFYYLSCIKQMCEHLDFSEEDVVSLMKSDKLFLKLSNEKRVVLFRFLVRFFGFRIAVKVLTAYSNKNLPNNFSFW